MLYFVPAWYQQNRWCETEQYWYARRMHTEFDDSVKHIQLFNRSRVYPFQIMLLSYAPNFRHFLHRQGVYHAPYWSCFDAIQEVKRKKAMVLSFHNLNWPEHIEFVYSPFVAIAMLRGEKYAQIEFGEDGNPIQIDMFRNGVIQRRNIYDDRGFVSSTIVYENGAPLYQDYLTDKGVWKIRHFLSDGHVEINTKAPRFLVQYQGKEQVRNFLQFSYPNMEQVIEEVLSAYLELTEEQDLFCVAMHELHAKLLQNVLKDKKKILSFFEDRYDMTKHRDMTDMVEVADYIITDSLENIHNVRTGVGKYLQNIIDITPFDSRVDFGISQQLNVQKILVPVDGLDDVQFAELIKWLGEYLPENENARIHLFTRQAEYNRKQQILGKTQECLRMAGLDEDWAVQEDGSASGSDIDALDAVPARFFVEQCVDELAVSKCMREQRMVVDMRSETELYLRIAAISMGIPQIVYTETQFVEHGENGFVVKDLSLIPEALKFYLDGLNNWNKAMIFSYELGKNFSTEVLVEEWKEVLNFVGQDSGTTTGV